MDLYFFVDYVKGELVGELGEYYFVEDMSVMFKGFNWLLVENVLYWDEFGYMLLAYFFLIICDGCYIGIVGVDVKVEWFLLV